MKQKDGVWTDIHDSKVSQEISIISLLSRKRVLVIVVYLEIPSDAKNWLRLSYIKNIQWMKNAKLTNEDATCEKAGQRIQNV